ncbi:MAG: DUF4402 domain-containing protein [Alphaproteobacteria bacterium]
MTKIFIFFSIFFLSISGYGQTVTPNRTLDFGRYYLDANGGTVRFNASGSLPQNISGGAVFNGGSKTGRIRTKGTVGESLEFYFSSGSIIGPGGTITVNNFTTTETSPMYYDIRRKKIFFGADAIYPASLSVGTYTGTATLYYKYLTSSTWQTKIVDLELEVQETPLSLTEIQEMDFGEMVADPAGGTISMDINGVRSNLVGTATFSGTSIVGEIQTSGHPNTAVSLKLPNKTTLTNGTDTIKINNFSSNATANPTLDAQGKINFKITANAVYDAVTSNGVYTGTYTLRVNY